MKQKFLRDLDFSRTGQLRCRCLRRGRRRGHGCGEDCTKGWSFLGCVADGCGDIIHVIDMNRIDMNIYNIYMCIYIHLYVDH